MPAFQRRAAAVVYLVLASLAGCRYCQDITDSLDLAAGGVVGRRFVLTADVQLVREDYLPDLMLVPIDETNAGGPLASIVSAGTTIAVVSVQQCTVWPGMTMDFTMARIDQGPFVGMKVATN